MNDLAGRLVALILGCAAIVPAHAQTLPSVNDSPDPYQIYGRCAEGAGFRAKQVHVQEVRRTLERVLAITVLECSEFTGGGFTQVVPCPRGSPYAYCLFNDNDGASNLVRLGVLEQNAVTAPNAAYTGCPVGARLQPKTAVVAAAGVDLRLLKGIVTLDCRPATGATGARVVRCPPGPSPYAYCVRSANDGVGNAVLLGVVAASDPGDPYALYGQCTPAVEPGWRPKVAILRDIGMPIADVRSIDIVRCRDRGGEVGEGFPDSLTRFPCSSFAEFKGRAHYDVCIWGPDAKGNTVVVGVVTAPATRR